MFGITLCIFGICAMVNNGFVTLVAIMHGGGYRQQTTRASTRHDGTRTQVITMQGPRSLFIVIANMAAVDLCKVNIVNTEESIILIFRDCVLSTLVLY